MWKPSKNEKVEEITKSHKERSITLDAVRPIKTVDGKRMCAWCTETQLHHGNQKYCTDQCRDSAMAWAYPQKEDALRYLLLRQDWKCFDCQYNYKPTMERIVERDRREIGAAFDLDSVPWYYIKRLKSITPQERKPEVDHVVPISKGGTSLGLGNHRCLCYSCHKAKTKIDNSGKRVKNET